MTNKQIWDRLSRAAASVYDPGEAASVCRIVAGELLGIPYLAVFTEPGARSGVNEETLERLVGEITSMRPVQYIVGRAAFCGMEFEVDESVLIPRPETEELVNLVVSQNTVVAPRILDIGTGSGCIAVSLARLLPESGVTAAEVSDAALETASRNASRNGARVKFVRTDILSDRPEGVFDVIVSNPPYVTESERALMRPNVLGHEPRGALFVPDSDPFLFYRRIAELGTEALADGGWLYFEINERFGAQTAELMRGLGYGSVTIRNDIYERPRIVYGWHRK